jgi:HSP20 family protein
MTGRRRDISDLQNEIQDLFADLWQVPRFAGLHQGFRPQCDCFRTDDPPALHLVLELPGVDPDSVELAASGRAIVISGERARPAIPGARYRQMEIEYGPFRRRVDLGEDVDTTRATASYERGMLRIVLPLAATPPSEGRIAIEVERR